MPSHGEYLADGLYRCDNDSCPNLRVSKNDEGTEFKDRFMFTGGSNLPNPDTNEPEYHEGVCPACGQPATKVDPENPGA